MVLHVKYPSMERQDLSQSQLGAFKFTPVDEIVQHSPHPHPHPLLLQQYTQSLQNGGLNQQSTSPETASEPSFFNHQIRPFLDMSQLRLGAPTIRPAVERISTSPQKRYKHKSQDSMRPNASSFRPQLYGSSENESLPSMYTSEVNGAPLSDSEHQYCSNPHNSLLRALEAEQEAHEITKTHLEQETTARQEAEAETRRLAEHNRGLLNSIKLLQSTVKHMVQKDSESVASLASVMDNNVKTCNKQTDCGTANGSILYDVVTNYKAMPRGTKQECRNASYADRHSINTSTQDIEFASELCRKKESKTKVLQRDEAIIAENKKPELDEIQKSAKTYLSTSCLNGTGASSNTLYDDKREAVTSVAENSPMLELPVSFLSKYGKKPSADITKQNEEIPHLATPRKAGLTVASAIKPQNFEKLCKLPSRVVFMPDALAIQWKVDGRHIDELRGARSETKSDNYFREYPIRYVPKLSDENLYRTVMVDFIPFGTSYSDLLAQIRGGSLESVQMYGPVGHATSFVTARIVFTDETGATGLYQRGQDPGIKINGCPVRVWQILEPTYPKNKELEEAIYVHGHTRILIINAPIDDIDQTLKRKLRNQIEAGLVLDVGRSYDGVPIVEFTSIEEATKALTTFLNDREFGGSDFDFDDDYCAAKYS